MNMFTITLAGILTCVTHGRVTFESKGQKQTKLTIYAEFTDMDESMESWITSMVERSTRNIKQLIESEVNE